MRTELDNLINRTLEGEYDSSWVLMHLLANCRELDALSDDRWEGQATERTWPDVSVEIAMPNLAYFLPTPAEFEEARRRLRLRLVEDERLNPVVLKTLNHLVDRTVFYPVLDVLEAYDGDPSRYGEVYTGVQALLDAVHDAPGADERRARAALQHVRAVGAGAVERGFSLSYWADEALAVLGDGEAQQRVEAAHPLPADWPKQEAERQKRAEARLAGQTVDFLLIIDEADEECAKHLRVRSMGSEGKGDGDWYQAYREGGLYSVSGSSAADEEDYNKYASLRSPVYVSRLAPGSLPKLLDDVAHARWRYPGRVQALVKDADPVFVLYMLRDGSLHRVAPDRNG